MTKEVQAVGCGEGVQSCGGGADQASPSAPGGLAQVGLEFGEGHFDGVQIGTVGGQVVELRAPGGDGIGHSGYFVRGEVVTDDDVAFEQFGREHFVQVGQEHGSVHWPVEEQWCAEPVAAQRGDEGGALPVSVRLGAQAAGAALRAPVKAGHFGVQARFVEEDEPGCGPLRLLLAPVRPGGLQFRPVLLGGAQGFFYS